jgi:transcription elongation factor Elf1
MEDHYGSAAYGECPVCKNETLWQLTRVSLWVVFFFFPIFPHDKKWFLRCETCESSKELTESEALEAKRKAEKAAPEVAKIKAERRKKCPQCGGNDVRRGAIEDGGVGHWCPHCEKSLEAMATEELAYTQAIIEQHEQRKWESCPQCGNTNIREAYIEDGGKGHWCDQCKKSLEAMGTTSQPQKKGLSFGVTVCLFFLITIILLTALIGIIRLTGI